jgi:AraC-like DNA-binding protein
MSQQPGAELVVNKLTEVVLVELIRINFGRSEKSRFVKALSDKRIAKALQHLHNSPQIPWTLEKMGEEIGMSRAAFAKRFKELVGQPMFEYLTLLRVQRARELLQETNLRLYEVASKVGYESDLAFAKTFKKYTGTTPTRYRKQKPNP